MVTCRGADGAKDRSCMPPEVCDAGRPIGADPSERRRIVSVIVMELLMQRS
jgi:hypothetical protein